MEREDSAEYKQACNLFISMLDTADRLSRCEGALGIGQLCGRLQGSPYVGFEECIRHAAPALVTMLFSNSRAEYSSAAYALGHLGALRMWTIPRDPDVLGRLFELWRENRDSTLRHLFARALQLQPLQSREEGWLGGAISHAEIESMLKGYNELDELDERPAALIVAWYRRALSDTELAERALTVWQDRPLPDNQTIRELLERLGVDVSAQ